MADNSVIPFGKYRGQELQQVMARDPAYIQWLTQQAWFTERYAPIYQLVVNNFAPPSDETPEHNTIQVRFLDFNFRVAIWELSDIKVDWEYLVKAFQRDYPKQEFKRNTTICAAQFEEITDVWFRVYCRIGKVGAEKSCTYELYHLAIEIKPSMGDDYPAVLRQMKRQKAAAEMGSDYSRHTYWFLLLDKFSSNAVTLAQVTKIFAHDDIKILLLSQIREQLLKDEQDNEEIPF